MRAFYVFWFFFCAGWGYLLLTFPHHEGDSLLNVLLTLVLAVLFGGIGTFFVLRSKSVSAANVGLNIDRKPWQLPLGMIQFVTITFVFSAIWGVGLSMLLPGTNVLYPLRILSLAVGGLLGAWAACRVYGSGLTGASTGTGEKPPAL
jgi:hypothetical protein